jgi:hypothetical protein
MRRREEAVIHTTGFLQVVSNIELEEEDRRRSGPQKETAAPATKGEIEAAVVHSSGFLQVCSVDETPGGWRQRRSPEKKETGKGTARDQQETVVQSRCAEVDWGSEVDQRRSSSETQARTFPEIGNSSHSWVFGTVESSGWDSGPSNASGWDDEQQDTTAAVTNERNEGWGQIEEIPFTSLDVSSFDCCDTEVEVLGNKVLVTVAATAATVESWVAEHQGQTMFGFDIEWRPTFQKGDYHEASLLQLSVEKRCLLVQLFFMDFFPESLKSLLADPRVILAGVGIRVCMANPRSISTLLFFVSYVLSSQSPDLCFSSCWPFGSHLNNSNLFSSPFLSSCTVDVVGCFLHYSNSARLSTVPV